MALTPPDVDALVAFALALGLGLLIGLERERHRREKVVLAGIRTYPLVALSGLLAAQLATSYATPTLISIGALITGGFALLMYWVRQAHGTLGLTSPVALFATFFVGVLVGVGREGEAIAAGILIAVLLFTKERLHYLARVMTPHELEGALYFLVIAFVLYPIAPDAVETPWVTLRARDALLIVILVSLISFLSFLAIRHWGPRLGLTFSGFLGGLVNSEATAASLTQLHRRRAPLRHAAYAGILLATATMFVRNLVIAGIADPSLRYAEALLVPLVWPSIVLLAWAYLGARNLPRPGAAVLALRSPFALRPAFVFAFWFALVSLATASLTQVPGLGTSAVYLTALGGLVSAGAVVASMGHLVATGQVTVADATTTGVLASLLSAANKPPIAWIGTRGLGARLVAPVVVAVATGGALLALL